VTDELRDEVETDAVRALSANSDTFMVKIFRDPTDALVYRICFTTQAHSTLNYSLFIFDLLVPTDYPHVAPTLTSPNTPSRLLSELLGLLQPQANNIDSDPDPNRIDRVVQRAVEILASDFSLSSAVGVASSDEENFNFYATFIKIKHYFKDVYFSSFDSSDQDWRDFILMHCSRFLNQVRSNFDTLYSFSETVTTQSTFFTTWVEPGSALKGEFSMEIVDDLINIFENISFQPQLPALEWADSAEMEPVPTELYALALSQFRYNSFSLAGEDGEYRHELKKYLAGQAAMESKTKRYINEMKALAHGLPCTAPNSIFVVADTGRMDLLKALIAGPSDTPYAHGLFMFDILCPEDYPYTPPKVNIVSTGNGTLRFNPNLYSDGFVCLSIINTWDGDPEERWNPSRSNLLQVLVSIQALVMDNHVIHKEPGYEDYEVAYQGNVVYCNIVRYGTMKYAMLELLTNTPPEFKEVILQHFALKKKDILRTVKTWLDTAREEHFDYSQLDPLVKDHNRKLVKEFSSRGHYQVLEEVAVELKAQLDRLPDIASEADLERLSQFARETHCEYQYRPLPKKDEDEGDSALSMPDVDQPEEDNDFITKFSGYKQQDSVDLVGISMPHSYADLPEARFEVEFGSEIDALMDSFDLYSRYCVFLLYSQARKNLWRLVCSIPSDTCLSNGILIFDVFVSDDGCQAVKLLNFRGLKLYSFIEYNGDVSLAKINSSKKRIQVWRVIDRVFKLIAKEERKATLETQLLLTTLNMKLCMIDLLQNPWPHIDTLIRDLLQAKKADIEAEISGVLDFMDEEGSDNTGLKREIEADNPLMMEEFRRRGTLRECFQETYGLLISALNS
jgi:ubiquitin-protein ligase